LPSIRAEGELMDKLSESAKPIKSNNLVCRKEKGFFLIFNFKNGIIHRFNETAKKILDLCDGYHTIADIAQELSQEYPQIKKDEILQDVQQTIKELCKRKLIVEISQE
jgi:DNA/RNA-binding domain of Phe-tRNA-synthetase-like protein